MWILSDAVKHNIKSVYCVTGLPIQVRDTGLAIKEDIPRSDVNKEYYTQNMEREVCLFVFISLAALSEILILDFCLSNLYYLIDL